MAKFLYTQYSFSNGELNPRLLGRTDIKEYFNSGKEVTNFIVNTEGGLTQCMGSNWAGRSDNGYLFTFLDIYAFAIESSSAVIRRIQQDGSSESFTMSDVSINVTDNITYWADFVFGTSITINKFTFLTSLDGAVQPIVIEKTGTHDFNIITYRDYAEKYGNPSLSAAERVALATPFVVNRNLDNYLELLGGNTVIAIEDTFTSGMIGSYLILGSGSVDYLYKITAFTSAKVVTVAAVGAAAANGNYELNSIPAWYDGNWPKVTSFFEERLLFANTDTNIDSMWASVVFNLARMSLPIIGEVVSDQNAFDVVPSTTEVSPILWLLPERYIAMGTSTEEFIVDGSDGIFTVATTRVRSVSKYGSHAVGLAFRAQSSTYFVERGGKVVREMSFSEENGGYVTRNIGILGPDVSNITRMTYDYSGKRIYINANGLKVISIDQSSGVLGWASINIDFNDISGLIDYNGLPVLLMRSQFKDSLLLFYREGITTTDSNLIGVDRLYFVDIDGDDYSLPSRYDPGVFVPGTTTIKVYSSVAEDYVDLILILASGHATFINGTYYVTSPDFVATQFTEAILPKARIETTPIQQGSPIGDAQIALNRVDKVGIRLYKANGSISVGTSETSLEDVTYGADFTGVKEVSVDGSPEIDHTIIVENTSIHPIILLGISSRGTGEVG